MNAWCVEVGQVWDSDSLTLLVLEEQASEWFRCVILRADTGFRAGEVIRATAFIIQYNAELVSGPFSDTVGA